jgi:hypothetical protein
MKQLRSSAVGVLARDNPFAAQRTDALRYHFEEGCWETHFGRLADLGFRGSIVGPQGSGKTTLLHQLAEHCRRRNLPPELVRASNDRNENRQILDRLAAGNRSFRVFLVDSAEQLGWLSWRRLMRMSVGQGLVVALHRRCRLPTWIECRTTWKTAERLLAELGFADAQSPLNASAQHAFHRHKGNLRMVFRQLYDDMAGGLHRPAGHTPPLPPALIRAS